MRYLWSQAAGLRAAYTGTLPLSHVLKAHFKAHPALGSRDRRLLSALLYGWYRAGKGLSFHTDVPDEPEQLLWQAALFLTETNKAAARLLPETWATALPASLPEKLNLLSEAGIRFDPNHLMQEVPSLSGGIAQDQWLESMLRQPRLFLRVREDRHKITELLRQKNIDFEWRSGDCLSLPNSTDVVALLPEKSYVVQDENSQRTGSFFQPLPGTKWWDCCAGAGGKSLLLTDQEKTVKLTVSDVRPAILHNLKKRFKRYGLPVPRPLTLDAADAEALATQLGGNEFDGIICDVPCSGSGTWARTPEQLYFFQPELLSRYTERQLKIMNQVPSYLRRGGRLIYITCSVFREENEAIVAAALTHQPLKLISQQLLNGTEERADSLFVAVLEKY